MHEGHRQRMRERLADHAASLTDHELLEVMLFEVISRRDTNPVAHRLLDSFCDLNGVLSAPPRLLCTVAGIGPRAAEFLFLMGTVLRRLGERARRPRPRLYSFADTRAFAEERFAGAEGEKLEAYFTDGDGYVLCIKSVQGRGTDRVVLSDREFGFILSELKPAGVILAHNHPSGEAQPSAEDDASVAAVGKLCRMHGASLQDSLILAEKDIFSYYGSGRLVRR